MKGLILKDIMGLKKISKNYLLFLIIYAIIASFSDMPAMFTSVVMVFSFMLPITALSFDERAKWDTYALTMPISRKDIVLSKYLLGLLFSVVAIVICFLYSFAVAKIDFKASALSAAGSLLVGMIFFSIIFPILLKFGVEKGRLTMIVIFLIPTALILMLPKLGLNIQLPSDKTFETIAIFAPIITIALFIASLFLSIKIYSSKEF